MLKCSLANVTLISSFRGSGHELLIARRFLSYKPVAFYSLKRFSLPRVNELKSKLLLDLKKFDVKGRIYLAPESGIGGINCQMEAPISQIEMVKSYFASSTDFGPVQFNDGMQDTSRPNFSKLRVLVKKNLVAVRKNDCMTAQDLDLQPNHLTPEDWHKELSARKQDIVLLDMRNRYEYDVGHFDHAIKMNVDTFRQGLDLLDELSADKPKDHEIYMYCTGGIRCSVAGAYLRNKGYQHVKMLQGGVTAYGHYVRNNVPSLFKGKNFTFDGRRGEPITDHVLTQCYHCGNQCDHITNCANTKCHLLLVQCEQCRSKMHHTCSSHCQSVLHGKEEYKFDYDYHRQVSEAW
ncbi:Rhodanese-like domain-containing protein [Parasitella parasitica]|nr:Rhodanese-like domain-containing protein [Parasitella parasitica]